MKKALLVTLFFIGISAVSFSQSAGKGSSEKSGGGFFSKMFHKGQKPHQQMSHFDSNKRDANINSNGTSVRRNRKRTYTVDGDGFGGTSQGKRRGKGSGTK
jgi:hypothetical protein